MLKKLNVLLKYSMVIYDNDNDMTIHYSTLSYSTYTPISILTPVYSTPDLPPVLVPSPPFTGSPYFTTAKIVWIGRTVYPGYLISQVIRWGHRIS